MSPAPQIHERALLKAGATVVARDDDGATALFYASMYGKLDAAKVRVHAPI